jgi:pyruvate dehydrogenase E2 component (dihydrolipoamide acetyltransferase)
MARTPVVMPKMSMTMTEGEVVEILVSVGQKVNAGDVIAVVGTDKTNMEVESDHEGEVIEIVTKPGDVIDVGEPIFILETAGEDLLAGLFGAAEPSAPAEVEVVEEPAAVVHATPVVSASQKILAMPSARKRAEELGIDLTQVSAASPTGVIKVTDLSGDSARVERAQATIAKVVTNAATIPQFSITKKIMLSKALPESQGARAQLLAQAWLITLAQNPRLNTSFDGGVITNVRTAFLLRSPLGFVAPVAEVQQINTGLDHLINSASQNQIPVANLGGSTTAITDLSEYGIDSANTLLLAGQTSALNIGTVFASGTGFVVSITIAADHRVCDPGDAALATLDFEKSLQELLDGNR